MITGVNDSSKGSKFVFRLFKLVKENDLTTIQIQILMHKDLGC